ncbi:MAG: hypothetical protein AAF184_17215, partial [Pseudomonadota bacterium]
DGHLVWVHDELRTTLAATRAGAWYLPIYDWLCDLAGEGGATLACRQRDPRSEVRFTFERVP